MKIGEQIKNKRLRERLSAEDLAIRLNVKKENIYKWERGSTPSDPEVYARVQDWLTDKVENSRNYSDDHQKYVALLESTNKTLERSIQLSLIAVLEGQEVLQAKVAAGQSFYISRCHPFITESQKHIEFSVDFSK